MIDNLRINSLHIGDKVNNLRGRFRGLAIPLLIGITLLIVVAMGMLYLQKQNEQNDLKTQIIALTNEVSRPVQESSDIQDKYTLAKQSIPASLKKEDVIISILGITEELGFNVSTESNEVSIVSEDGKKETVMGSSYRVLPFSITIKGDYERIMTFIRKMDSISILQTLVVQNVIITTTNQTAATLDFKVYTTGE